MDINVLMEQMENDVIRVVLVAGYLYGIWLISKFLTWLLHISWNALVKACKAIIRFIKKQFNRLEVLVTTAEKDEEV